MADVHNAAAIASGRPSHPRQEEVERRCVHRRTPQLPEVLLDKDPQGSRGQRSPSVQYALDLDGDHVGREGLRTQKGAGGGGKLADVISEVDVHVASYGRSTTTPRAPGAGVVRPLSASWSQRP